MLPAVTLLLAAVLSVGQAVLAEVACVDAARAGARAAARGDDPASAREAAIVASGASGGVEVAVARSPHAVAVTVTRPVRLLAISPVVRVSARALAQPEQLVEDGGS